MKRQLYWVCATLVILLAVVSVFLFVQHELAEREQLEKELAAANKMLKESEKSKKVLSPDTVVRPPPPGETPESGHWHEDVWHKTAPKTTVKKDNIQKTKRVDSDKIRYIYTEGPNKETVALATRIIQERPYSEDAMMARRFIAFGDENGHYDRARALSILREGLEYHPESPILLDSLALETMHDFPEDAISYANKILSLQGVDDGYKSGAHASLGWAYQRLGDYKTAWVHYQKAQSIVRQQPPRIVRDTPEHHVDTFPPDDYSDQIAAIEAGKPLVEPIQREKSVEQPIQPSIPLDTSVDGGHSDVPHKDTAPIDDFFFPENPSAVPDPQAMGDMSPEAREAAARRAFLEKQRQQAEPFHPDEELSRHELDTFIEWAQSLMNDPPNDTNNFLEKELAAHLLGKKTTFKPNRLTRAFEYMQRHGQTEGMQRLQKNDPELAKEVQRLRSENRRTTGPPRTRPK